MIGRAISHYRVLGTLGSGGMGVVYLAEDERLGRQVALKFLPQESVTNRHALDRFRVEARAASALSHPGICAIFDIGEDAGTPYIVMEALRGESLRDRINRGPMKVGDLLDIAVQLADALDAAHAQGIIHRDIKPSNIFIGEKNRTKILDFGLAKLTQSAAPPSSGGLTRAQDASTHRELTMPGSALGTVSYMSPEQARGEDVDTRTDLFSFGVVLYEMATGIQAFGGSTQAVVFDAILNRTPQPVSHINPLIPPRLEGLIATSLEKERDLRHQHASDIEAELKRIRRDLESGTLLASAASRTVVVPAAERRSATMSAAKPEPQARRAWIWVSAVVAVLLAITAAGFTLWSRRPTEMAALASPATTEAAPAPASAPPPETATAEPLPQPEPVPARPQEATPPARPSPQPQPPPVRPSPEARPQAQPALTPAPTPQRPPADEPAVSIPAPSTTTRPQQRAQPETASAAPSPAAVQPQPTPAAAPPATQGSPVQPPAIQPAAQPQPPATPPPTTPPPAAQPPRTAAATPTTRGGATAAPTLPPTSPVESDDAAIRSAIRTYERAIETKSVELFRSVLPGLSAAEENRLRDSFSQVESQQVDIVIEDLRVEGRTATVRLSRRDTIVSGGRRQTAMTRQTLRFEKTASGWIITDIVGR